MINYTGTISHKTDSRELELRLVIKTNKSENLLDFADYETISNICKDTCVNYNHKWSCPPTSSCFSDLYSKFKYCHIILMYSFLQDFDDIDNKYLRIKAANSILKSRCDKIARKMEGQTEGYAILSGSCRLYKSCKKKTGEGCSKPQLMRFSMEATGLNVQKICNALLGHELLWYQKGKELPEYTSVVCCVLSNKDDINIREIIENFV